MNYNEEAYKQWDNNLTAILLDFNAILGYLATAKKDANNGWKGSSCNNFFQQITTYENDIKSLKESLSDYQQQMRDNVKQYTEYYNMQAPGF